MNKIFKQRGFTLIELVMVIMLVGILAATALPRFADFTTSARKAAAAGIAGGLGAGVDIAHAQWLVMNQPASITLLEGNKMVNMSVAPGGWPTATNASDCLTNVWKGVLSSSPIANDQACTGSCQYSVLYSNSKCTFVDQQGTGINIITYDPATGAVTIN